MWSWGLPWIMKKSLRQLFLCKDALINPKTMQPNNSLEEKMASALARIILFSARPRGQRSATAWLNPSARLGLIFSSGWFIFNCYLIGVWLNFAGMSPLKGSQDDHWKGKISWRCHFRAKPNIILLENCPGASTKALTRVLGGSPEPLGAG